MTFAISEKCEEADVCRGDTPGTSPESGEHREVPHHGSGQIIAF